jgi:OmcA/MtrC family decaheme c-type cytochrome
MHAFRSRTRAVAIAAALTSALAVAQNSIYSPRDKAFFAAPAVVNFVRPGLVLKIESATIASDGTIQAQFKLTDPQGLPLDRQGVTTPGAVSVSFIAATIPAGQTQYTAYTTRVQTSPITKVSATQAGTDSGGVLTQVGDGEYTYKFGTKAPSSIDRSATHSIGAYATRDLTSFNLGTQYSNDVFNFVPDGSKLTVIRDVVRTSSCNQCHDPLAQHGGARQNVELCVLCHQPQTIDPDTGNTVDLKVFIHKIHMGANLPSVKAGTPYQIIGFGQSVNDYSTVVFPVGNDVRNCTICHTPAATQAKNYITASSRAACGSCHDDVNFATGENHAGGPQLDDNQCSVCHTPQGELEFDASILGGHTIPRFSRDMPGVVFQLLKVSNGSAGSKPTVTFTLKDKSGNPIPLSAMSRVALVLSGPTTDYSFMLSEDATKGTCGSDGTCMYTFQNAINAGATGTYSIGIEGERNITLQPGTTKEMKNVRDAGANQVINFSVDGSALEPRRTVVDLANCNRCHTSLTVHGDNRNQVVMCVLCHNPNGTDSPVRPASAGPPQAIDFSLMIHKIHTGENLTTDYTIFGFGGSQNNFNGVRFPGDRRNCAECHVNGSEQLPLKDKLLPVQDPRGFITPVGPTTAACTACHTDKSVASHALSNTTQLGESCATCHGPDDDFAVSKVHAR